MLRDAKPTRARRQTRARRGQEARPRGHRRRDLLSHVNGSLTNPRLVNSIEEFLPWDGSEDLEDALVDLAEVVHGTEKIPEPKPVEPEPEPEPVHVPVPLPVPAPPAPAPVPPVPENVIPAPAPEPSAMRQAANRQRLSRQTSVHRIEEPPKIIPNLPTWEPKEVEITNPNYPPASPPVRPIPKSEEESPSRIRKRRRAVSLVAELQQSKEAAVHHPPTVNCNFCEARQLQTTEICTSCARDVHTGKLPGIEDEKKIIVLPEIDLSSRAIKKMKKADAIQVCRSLGLSTDGTVKDLKAMLTAYRNGTEEE